MLIALFVLWKFYYFFLLKAFYSYCKDKKIVHTLINQKAALQIQRSVLAMFMYSFARVEGDNTMQRQGAGNMTTNPKSTRQVICIHKINPTSIWMF